MKGSIVYSLILSSFSSLILYAHTDTNNAGGKGYPSEKNKSKSTKVIWKKVPNSSEFKTRDLIWKKIDYKMKSNIKIKNDNTVNEGLNKRLSNQIYNEKMKHKSKRSKLKLDGLSVATAEPFSAGTIYGKYYLNNSRSWGKRIVWGSSKNFNYDISFASISQNLLSDKYFNEKYNDLDKLLIRGGAKVIFSSQIEGDFITSAARISSGLSIEDEWLFAELIQTYGFNDNLSLNVNPKVSISDVASPSAIGISLNWELMNNISLIPEFNFALNESTDNYTIAIRFSKLKSISFDIFSTNSLNLIDTGQLHRSDFQLYGLNVAYTFYKIKIFA